jgi:hypothetical protein
VANINVIILAEKWQRNVYQRTHGLVQSGFHHLIEIVVRNVYQRTHGLVQSGFHHLIEIVVRNVYQRTHGLEPTSVFASSLILLAQQRNGKY